jgi:sec-independent protein translocase protein TatA
MFGLGMQELMVILLIVLVLFGGAKLPDLAKSLGRSMKEFKKGVGDDEETKAPATVAASPAPTRVCASCKAALESAWTHCPACGAPAPPAALPQSPAPKV